MSILTPPYEGPLWLAGSGAQSPDPGTGMMGMCRDFSACSGDSELKHHMTAGN